VLPISGFSLNTRHMKRPSNTFLVLYIIITASTISSYHKNYGLNVFSIPGLFDCFLVPALGAGILTWLINFGNSLYRKYRGRTDLAATNPQISIKTVPLESLDSKKPWFKNLKIVIPSVVVLLLIVSSLFGQNNKISKYSDLFLEQERMISDDLQQWNIAALPISQAVQSLSDGSTTIPDAQNKVVTAMPELKKALRQLDSDCPKVQKEVSGTSSDIQTINTMFNMLRVGCEATAQETDLVLAIYTQQISSRHTPELIISLANKLAEVQKRKSDASIAALDAMKQYLSPDQLKRVSTLKGLLSN
jgi:hypothetical protein